MKNLPNKLLLLRYKLNYIKMIFRILKWRKLGMHIGDHTQIGKINCESPNSIFLGSHCELRDNISFWIKSPFDKNNQIIIGDSSILGIQVEFNCSGQISIGNNCLISSSVIFVDSSHIFEKMINVKDQSIKVNQIKIGNDVWIGSNCVILNGINIGEGAIVGANSLVNKSIPAYEIWAGSPARKIEIRK